MPRQHKRAVAAAKSRDSISQNIAGDIGDSPDIFFNNVCSLPFCPCGGTRTQELQKKFVHFKMIHNHINIETILAVLIIPPPRAAA